MSVRDPDATSSFRDSDTSMSEAARHDEVVYRIDAQADQGRGLTDRMPCHAPPSFPIATSALRRIPSTPITI